MPVNKPVSGAEAIKILCKHFGFEISGRKGSHVRLSKTTSKKGGDGELPGWQGWIVLQSGQPPLLHFRDDPITRMILPGTYPTIFSLSMRLQPVATV